VLHLVPASGPLPLSLPGTRLAERLVAADVVRPLFVSGLPPVLEAFVDLAGLPSLTGSLPALLALPSVPLALELSTLLGAALPPPVALALPPLPSAPLIALAARPLLPALALILPAL
jgi:hypothetical protein